MVRVRLQYGVDGMDVELPASNVTVLAPRYVPGLPDEAAAFREAVERPLQGPPLPDVVRAGDRVAVVIPDVTRPLPSDRLLPWLFDALRHVHEERLVIVNGTGSHRANTPDELRRMVGPRVLARYRVVNHDAHDPATLVPVGTGADGQPVLLNRAYVEADRRIVLGFVEPHFMAGFSGGYKGVFPAVADIDSIMRYHDAKTIGHPRSTWGVVEGNPTQAIIRRNGALLPVDFCVNVTLNRDRQITRFFCGDVARGPRRRLRLLEGDGDGRVPAALPDRGDDEQRLSPRPEPLPDGQGHVGGRAGRGGGRLHRSPPRAATTASPSTATSASCSSSTPRRGRSSTRSRRPGFSMYDQWEAQLLALVRLKARVGLYSEIPAEEVRRAHLEPLADVGATVARRAGAAGRDAPVAVLPEGPMTIPYLAPPAP